MTAPSVYRLDVRDSDAADVIGTAVLAVAHADPGAVVLVQIGATA